MGGGVGASKGQGVSKMASTVQVSVELPTGVLSALRQEPEQFVREMRLAAAVKWYELELISQAKAAEVAGVSRAEFLAALPRFGVSPFQVTVEELRSELDAPSEHD
jgi:predicted HTH domain antitoxin